MQGWGLAKLEKLRIYQFKTREAKNLSISTRGTGYDCENTA